MKIIKKNKILLIVFLILIVLFCFLKKYISSPSIGKITSNPNNQLVTPTSSVLQNFEGNYFSFKYNNNYELRQNDIKEDTLIDQITLQGKTGFSNQIIAYREINVSNINEVSAVQMRRLKKDDYIEENITLDGVSALFFKKTTGIEFVVIALKDDKLLSISLTANSNDETSYKIEFDRTLNSFKWH